MRAVCLAIALAACGMAPPPPVVASPVPVPPPPPPPPAPDAAIDAAPTGAAAAVARLTELTEAMCRCTDSACANHLAEDVQAWRQALGRSEDSAPPTEGEQAQMVELSARLTRCMTDAMTSPAAGSPP
jgi:hypothetical protein